MHTGVVFRLLKDVGVDHKVTERALFTNRPDYLGHIIRLGRLEAANHTVNAICEHKGPATVTQLRFVIEVCNVFRRFIPNVLRIDLPL